MHIHCRNCGGKLQGEYCHVCGEKVLKPEDKAFSRWLKDVLTNLVQFDGKFFKSLVALSSKPGVLAEDYFQGKRKPYLKIINLFFIANLLYFVLPSFDTFKTNLEFQMNSQVYSGYVTESVEKYLLSNDLDIEEFRILFNTKTAEVSKLILVALAPFLGFLIFLLHRKKLYLTDGFNLALQFWAAYILLYLIPFSLIIYSANSWFGDVPFMRLVNSDFFLSMIALVFSAIYFWHMLKWLSDKITLRIIKIFLLLLSFVPIIIVYRALLFYITMWTV
ncbi:MAG: hypothetical protein COW03_05690 [Cytophagales bacterium CG12_big_fil_rev_8_21_14_0_65_40_12]|nr:MAG: hypothetical protein COW03_05690 [Cytophagales bacterium CG12_big_fil_rev_8_21_14_0_65_40_12]PIW03223.1 MAG: hypothetical protein COW40_15935 [Cytophagales bacterium CG17_big_fil_post_rev_8_21_14_2_50_40_13]